jgi:hypothetical protein
MGACSSPCRRCWRSVCCSGPPILPVTQGLLWAGEPFLDVGLPGPSAAGLAGVVALRCTGRMGHAAGAGSHSGSAHRAQETRRALRSTTGELLERRAVCGRVRIPTRRRCYPSTALCECTTAIQPSCRGTMWRAKSCVCAPPPTIGSMPWMDSLLCAQPGRRSRDAPGVGR